MDMMEQMQEIMKRPLVLPYPEHLEITRKIAADGIVLLKNAEEILPLKTKTVALFGAVQLTRYPVVPAAVIFLPHM